ncbi:hypothetical protein D3C71_2143480 [compost metagenome]
MNQALASKPDVARKTSRSTPQARSRKKLEMSMKLNRLDRICSDVADRTTQITRP